MKEKLKNVLSRMVGFWTPIRIAVFAIAALFFWFLAFGDQGLYQLRRLVEIRGNLLFDRQKQNDDIDSHTKEKEMLQDPVNTEMTIRRELGYIKPGEVVFEKKKK
jgi:cell division protein FtsB